MSSIIFQTDGPVATITLNRPDAFNALNTEMRASLLQAIERAEAEDKVRIVIIKGEGRGFCAGADLKEGLGKRPVEEQLEEEYKPFLMAIHEGEKLYIAQVHGSAAGIGGALAMTCDFCVMAEDANIYLAFAAIGLIPDGGKTWHLWHGMGYSRALQAIVEGQKILASECFANGLINKVVSEEMLAETVSSWAQELSQGAPLAQIQAKKLLKQVGSISYEEAVSLEAVAQGPLSRSKDCAAAVMAFVNKQKPVFTGE